MANWLKTPANHRVIARWTVGDGRRMQHALALPPPPDPAHFTFLALGDTGDSEGAGSRISPQDAVAQFLAADAALPGSPGDGFLVLHVGDVVYMAGEQRLYDRNFRRPYAAFLTPESTVDRLVFRAPFLPVPGNHDYYDLHGWGEVLARVPVLRMGLRAIAQELFAFNLPEGGSEMGGTYMEAFVNLRADTSERPLSYCPGEETRLPNRYYRFRAGIADFFALDSNTLDAPPSRRGAAWARDEAARHLEALAARERAITRQIRRDQRALARWERRQWEDIARDAGRLAEVAARTAAVGAALARLQEAVRSEPEVGGHRRAQRGGPGGTAERSEGVRATERQGEDACEERSRAAADAHAAVDGARRRWSTAAEALAEAQPPSAVARALQTLSGASDEACAALRDVDGWLVHLPEGESRAALLAARAAADGAIRAWSQASRVEPPPRELCDRLRRLSEDAVDVQRDLALERRRWRFRPEDHDGAQLRWLEAGLAEAERERPDGWRIVYLHHPLYTTIANHCEGADVQGVRENLLALLRDRAHLVLAGHAHAFEWIRAETLPHTGLFVTGGGGQVTLRRSLLEPRLRQRYLERYDALRAAGVVECAVGGRETPAVDGEAGPLYHYIEVEVTPEALFVRPIGVRRLTGAVSEGGEEAEPSSMPEGGGSGSYRREAPMPVHHAALAAGRRDSWHLHRLEAVEIRREAPPRPHWA